MPDTTVSLYDPEIFHALGTHHKPGMCHIYVHTAVVREIDGIKNGNNRRAGSAREIARDLDRWGSYGDLINGVPLPSGGVVHVFSDYDPIDERASVADNRIVSGAMVLNRINHGNVTVLTTDHNMRTIARVVLIT